MGHWAYRACKALPEAIVYSIDPWYDPADKPRFKNRKRIGWVSGDDNFREWITNLKQYENRVVAIRKTSEEASKDFDLPIDLLFIDGDHHTNFVLKDLRFWVPKVKPGGLVVGHDYGDRNWGPQIKKALDIFWPKGNYKVGPLYFNYKKSTGICFWKKIE